MSHETVYVTDLGDVWLTQEFIEQARSRWPGTVSRGWINWETGESENIEEDAWESVVLDRMTDFAVGHGGSTVSSLEQIGL